MEGQRSPVVVIDRNAEISVDLSDEESTRSGAAELLDWYGCCDVLVHAAAAVDALSLTDMDAATWRRVQAVNVESPLWLAQAFTPGMAQRGFGRIVFIASDTFWDPPAPSWVPTSPARPPWSGSCDLWRVRSVRTASP